MSTQYLGHIYAKNIIYLKFRFHGPSCIYLINFAVFDNYFILVGKSLRVREKLVTSNKHLDNQPQEPGVDNVHSNTIQKGGSWQCRLEHYGVLGKAISKLGRNASQYTN